MSTNKTSEEVNRNRRSFLKTGLTVAGATAARRPADARNIGIRASPGGSGSSALTAGDVAILRFLAAGEALEADFYTQYNELGGIRDGELQLTVDTSW